jgi:N-acyl-D-aspartate/D-glutamate deacylase
MYDLLISGGRLIDGMGTPWYWADVAVTGDRIVAIGVLNRGCGQKNYQG